ncbi:MAG: sulfotransferase family 2 domain-containing protein [Pseudomonadota bacterium]
MLIFHGQRLVVFSIPRTASTSLHEALRRHADLEVKSPPKDKHMNVRRFERWCARTHPEAADYTRVAVMREPLSRLASWYRYRRRAAVSGTPSSTENLSFDEFIELGLTSTAPQAASIGNQHRFLTREDGVLAVDEIFCLERRDVLLAYLEARFGPVRLKHRNAAPLELLDLDPAREARLRAARAAEFALFERVAATGRLTVSRG